MAALPSWKYGACFHSARLVGRARRVRSVDASVRRRVQCPTVVVSAGPADVAARARPVKHKALVNGPERLDGGASSNREAVARNSFRGMTNISEPRERNARDENGAVPNSTRVSALAFVGWLR